MPEERKPFDFAEVLTRMAEGGASDVHLSPMFPPAIRQKGQIEPLHEYGPLSPQQTRDVVYSILNDDQRKKFESAKQLDLAYAIPNVARFRVNCFFQRGSISAAFRRIPHEIPNLEDLRLPPILRDFTKKPRGFVLVTGPTGSGKSTSLAAMIDIINRERKEHILTIEDPIEFLHPHRQCLVNQREIGADAEDFAQALKSALREDPDVILVGEMRDLETVSTALTAAETGHLVFATLHTQSTSQTVDRIIDVFPSHQQGQVRMQLSIALQGIVTQQLLPTADGEGRVVGCEVLAPTPAVRNLIREGKTHQIYSAIQTSGALGMQTMDSHLAQLYRQGLITRELAEQRSAVPEELKRLMGAGPGQAAQDGTPANGQPAQPAMPARQPVKAAAPRPQKPPAPAPPPQKPEVPVASQPPAAKASAEAADAQPASGAPPAKPVAPPPQPAAAPPSEQDADDRPPTSPKPDGKKREPMRLS